MYWYNHFNTASSKLVLARWQSKNTPPDVPYMASRRGCRYIRILLFSYLDKLYLKDKR